MGLLVLASAAAVMATPNPEPQPGDLCEMCTSVVEQLKDNETVVGKLVLGDMLAIWCLRVHDLRLGAVETRFLMQRSGAKALHTANRADLARNRHSA